MTSRRVSQDSNPAAVTRLFLRAAPDFGHESGRSGRAMRQFLGERKRWAVSIRLRSSAAADQRNIFRAAAANDDRLPCRRNFVTKGGKIGPGVGVSGFGTHGNSPRCTGTLYVRRAALSSRLTSSRPRKAHPPPAAAAQHARSQMASSLHRIRSWTLPPFTVWTVFQPISPPRSLRVHSELIFSRSCYGPRAG